MSKELTVVKPSDYAVMNSDTDVREAMLENLDGENISARDLDQISVPGAGNTTWTIPSGDDEVEAKEVEGIIIYNRNTRTSSVLFFRFSCAQSKQKEN